MMKVDVLQCQNSKRYYLRIVPEWYEWLHPRLYIDPEDILEEKEIMYWRGKKNAIENAYIEGEEKLEKVIKALKEVSFELKKIKTIKL